MDLDELRSHYRSAVENRDAARSKEDRQTYLGLVDFYAERIRRYGEGGRALPGD